MKQFFNEKNAHCRDGLIDFDPSQHIYTFNGTEFKSVTTIVEECFEAFDADYWARVKRPGDPESLKREWEDKAREARELGTLMHDRIERYYLGEQLEPEAASDPTFRHFLNFANEHRLTPYRTEWRIFSERSHVAGTLDFLAVDENGRFTIYDWKRSTKVVDKYGNPVRGKYPKYAKRPLNHLPDTTYHHYALQVSIYRFILAEHYGIEVDNACLGVFHEDLPCHFCVKLPYLRDEVIKLMDLAEKRAKESCNKSNTSQK